MRRLAGGMLAALICLTGALAVADSTPEFAALLDETQLLLQPPADSKAVPLLPNPVFSYEKALRSADGRLEIRYALRPLGRLKIDYDDPHGTTPDPNHIFPLMFESLASQLSGGSYAPSQIYSAEQAHKDFNADWAAASVFDVTPDFNSPFSQGLLLALHRNKVSDAYVIFLFDDYEQVKPALKAAMTSLRYRDPAVARAAD